jgi:hypothetical protein
MSQLNVDKIKNRTGSLGGPTFSSGLTVSAGTTASILGDLEVKGTQTVINTDVLEVADLNIGIASTSTKLSNANLDGAGLTIYGSDEDKTLTWDNGNGRMAFNTNFYAPKLYGSGANLTDVISGIGITAGSVTANLGTGLTAINFSGATVTYHEATGISTITIATAGLSTEFSTISGSPTPGITTYLDLSNAQDHKWTCSGIVTFSCTGGTEGESHTVRVINSGITTVGFNTFFLWPSGSSPTLPTGDGAVSLISFTVHRVGAGGTQLLAGASLNYS